MSDPDPDEATCLVVVCCYEELAAAVAVIAREAARRIGASPELGDFIELEFMSLGHSDVGQAEAACTLLRKLTEPRDPPASHLAVVILDDSADLAYCAAQECSRLADEHGLRLSWRAMAVREGAQGAVLDPSRVAITNATGPVNEQFVDHLRRYCEALMEFIANSGDPGNPAAAIAEVHDALKPQTLSQLASMTTPEGTGPALGDAQDATSEPDSTRRPRFWGLRTPVRGNRRAANVPAARPSAEAPGQTKSAHTGPDQT